MVSQRQLFPASVIGSMPRSELVKDLVVHGDSELSSDGAHRLDATIRYIVALQEQAGLDVVTDGEWRRKSYIGVISELADGFELSTTPDGRPWTVVVDRLAPKAPGFVASEVAFLRKITNRKIKATLPSPALLGERLWDPRQSSGAYPSRRDFVLDCVAVLRQEIKLLRDAGADIIQIDDPHLALFVDPEVRRTYGDPDEAANFAVDTINALVEGIDDVVIAEHLCRRAGARARGEFRHHGSFKLILDQLNRLRVDHLTLEFSGSGDEDFEILRDLREDFEIGLGCVDVMPGRVDDPETIAERVRKAAAVIDPWRITLNPDCGFSPGAGACVPIDEAYQKLRNEAVAAEILRKEYAR